MGKVPSPDVPLATAVAASSAFPPVLSPLRLKLQSGDFEPNTGLDLQREPFTTRVLLTDGGSRRRDVPGRLVEASHLLPSRL